MFRQNDNPHNAGADKDEFYLFGQTTGSKGSRAGEELRKFMKGVEETLIINLKKQRNPWERKRTQLMSPDAGKKERNNTR